MLKRIISSILLAIFLLVTVVGTQVHAQSSNPAPQETWYAPDYQSWYLKVYDSRNPQEIFGERYTAAQVTWVIYSFAATILNALSDENT